MASGNVHFLKGLTIHKNHKPTSPSFSCYSKLLITLSSRPRIVIYVVICILNIDIQLVYLKITVLQVIGNLVYAVNFKYTRIVLATCVHTCACVVFIGNVYENHMCIICDYICRYLNVGSSSQLSSQKFLFQSLS